MKYLKKYYETTNLNKTKVMKTTDKNTLIAEFMEWESFNQFSMIAPKSEGDCWTFEDMKFHSDWNWLMEVVEKIESLNYSIEINKQEENDYQCLVIQKDIKVQTFSKIKIEAVYNACVAFIEWYNEQ